MPISYNTILGIMKDYANLIFLCSSRERNP